MKSTRFLELFGSLKKEDNKKFGDLVYSPFFNKNSRVIKLWEFLKSHGEQEENLRKEKLAFAIFGNEKYNDANYRMVISDFVGLIEIYLFLTELDKDKLEEKLKLLEIFQEKKLPKSFSKYLDEIEYELDRSSDKDMTHYYRLYVVECLRIMENIGGELLSADEYITNAFICMKLDNMIKESVSNNDSEILFKKEILGKIEKNINSYMRNHPVIYGRCLAYKMIAEKNKNSRKELKRFLEDKKNSLGKKTLSYFEDVMKNYKS